MNAVDRLDVCIALVHDYHERFVSAVKAGRLSDEPPAIALDRAMRFGERAICTVKLLLETSESAILASILCRSYYELSVRLLWASREPGGWHRLIAYYANEELKWAREAESFPGTAGHAKIIRAEKEKILDRTDADGNPYEPAPNIAQTLRDVAKHTQRDGDVDDLDPQYEYTNVYRALCRNSHAHLIAIGDRVPPHVHLRTSVISIAIATLALLRAVCYCGSDDEESQISSIRERIKRVLIGCSDLRFDAQ